MPQNEPEIYDYVIIGTGLTETAISSILSSNPNVKILHLDTNQSYGNEFSTFNYKQLLSHFESKKNLINIKSQENISEFDKKCLEKNREFNIDLTPKLLLQDSPMKDFLLNNKIQDMVSFTSIKGSYLFTDKLHSIPTNETQSLKSSAIGFMQKYKVIKFFWNIRRLFDSDTIDIKNTMLNEFKSYGLNEESIDFIGHAIALNLDDKYLNEPAGNTYKRIIRYISSLISYDNSESPYIYPLYGLSELCQSFARKSALNGTVFMLNTKINELSGDNITILDPNGDIHYIKPKVVISDPKYWPGSTIQKKIIRCIMILRKGSLDSRNVIYLKRHLKRENDVFCVILNNVEYACPSGYEIGILSTIKETEKSPEEEIRGVLKNYDILRYFIEIREVYTNFDQKNVYFTKNVDESALMDNIYDDISDICDKLKIKINKE